MILEIKIILPSSILARVLHIYFNVRAYIEQMCMYIFTACLHVVCIHLVIHSLVSLDLAISEDSPLRAVVAIFLAVFHILIHCRLSIYLFSIVNCIFVSTISLQTILFYLSIHHFYRNGSSIWLL